MKRFHTMITAMILAVFAIIAGIPAFANAAAHTPPGPGSVNPAVQSDGILVPDLFGSTPNWNLSPPLRKFVDTLAPLGCTSTNNLGQCIPVAVPDTRSFPGADYYEIELRRYTEKMHTDLPNNTTLQGYVQTNNGTNASGTTNNVAPAPIHYLGPIIVAQKGRPVRIKFTNKLPLENNEPFFLPVDTSVMGSGMGSKSATNFSQDCDPVWDPRGIPGIPSTKPNCAEYTKNRAELHLHGGFTPWISDGIPHQWITPAGENTPYKKGTSVQYVPDMWFDAAGNVITSCAGQNSCNAAGASNNPGDGAQTYYYTNEQSARLMFYHDHSYGITRLNVYAGEAAGYLITDPTEQDLVNRGIIPADQIPLIIQDKAFVDSSTIATLDPTWVWGTGASLPTRWIDNLGTDIPSCAGQATCAVTDARKIIGRTPKTGDLWWPHVYMPAENPSDLGGVNPLGRWVYGMYFWPPTTGIKFLPVDNPYYDCDPLGICNSPWEPPKMPATPNPSWVAEAFVDTPMVNGTVYPKLTVQPKAYRLRVLNAAHDRFFNLQLYEADTTVNPNVVNAAACTAMGGCATNTEVKMVPAIKYPAFPDWDASADQRTGGVPDPATAGPAWIQIGNEGGFLPTPVAIANKPISFVMDPTLFNVGNVNDGTVILGPAERADVIIDFSQYAGKTLILYNDAPAAFPAFVPNNDYYTDAPDQTGTGGHPGPKAGIGPNTRTIMQINVAATTPAQPFNLAALMDEFATTPAKDGVFKKSQHATIVGQSAYDSAYNTTFPSVSPYWGIVNIGDQKVSFQTLNPLNLTPETVSLYPLEPKALHDEMGAVWDEYGRMSAKLGVELPNTSNINQIFVMQNYVDPPTENLQDGKVQIWKLTHNGVDTHPLHFHLFDVQVINRVGWDGFIRLPWPNELGWKETVRISPLEDTIVALRPKAPPVPFALADSTRLKNPTYLPGATDGFMSLEPLTGQAKVPPETNELFNYGAEYVWHCHILSHEEQDMMRTIVLRVATAPPLAPSGLTVTKGFQKNSLAWTDNSYNVTVSPYNMTIGFKIERCQGNCSPTNGTFTQIAEMSLIPSATPSFVDTQVAPGTQYTYRVIGYNRYTDVYTGPATAVWRDGVTAPAYSATVTTDAWSQATGVTLTADFTSPHIPPVKFVALGSGSNAPYQYRFRLNDGNTTSVVQDYSVTRFWTMPVGMAAGNYTVIVDVRTNFASTTPDITNQMTFSLLPIVDNMPPVTTAIPPAGAFLNPVQVYLQVNEPGSVIRYTIDGSNPTTSPTAIIYTGAVNISATTTLKYYATDPAGNAEVVNSGLYELRPVNIAASVKINGGATVTSNTAVTLDISAIGATKMRFSNDGITYGPDEPFATTKAWNLVPATPDGPKSVYARFTDTNGILQEPVIAQITLDTVAPVTTSGPVAGTYITPVNVTLTPNETNCFIKYTIDGSNPVTSATAVTYSGPFTVSNTTAVMFFATDLAGNVEPVKTSIYTIHIADLAVNAFKINAGAILTNSTAVSLTIDATDATGISKMRFSNDGITYSADEPYVTTTNKAWTLTPGDGLKNVFVRFTDGAGILYEPVIAQITLDSTAPVTGAIPLAGSFINPIIVYLSANEVGSTIRYTIDGSDPVTSATAAIYTGSISVSATTTIRYYATDPAGNAEVPTTGVYTITAPVISASVKINGGATATNNPTVTLDIAAVGVAKMRFSNDGVNYSVDENYATSKVWTLDPGDGIKSVYVRFVDGAGSVFDPVVAQITLDTTAPITAVNPIPGTYAPLTVTLTANEPATIYYTTDGTVPTTASLVYTVPIFMVTSTTVNYFAVDTAGNVEAVKSAVWDIPVTSFLTSLSINNGSPQVNNTSVNLTVSATSPTGVSTMQFSNDGVNYSAEEAYATTKLWQIPPGDGIKTVYVRFRDQTPGGGILSSPATASVNLDTTPPVTVAGPIPGIYTVAPGQVNLTVNELATTYYTIDGTIPTTASTVYAGAITVFATTTINYFSVDQVGNIEPVKSGTWTISGEDLTASVVINNNALVTLDPAVTLTLSAIDPLGIQTMQFSNDGVNFTPEEPYGISKTWFLAPGDGLKTVYVRFRDMSLPSGHLYAPVTASITLDATAPVSSALPAPGTYSTIPTMVALSANEPADIYYTIDGTVPTTASTRYSTPIPVSALTTIRYFAVDRVGHVETTIHSGTWDTHLPDMTATVQINNGATQTKDPTVSLTLSAIDVTGVATMQFSNDGLNYSAEEPYGTSKTWTLSPSNGIKTVYVRFRDNAGLLYPPFTATIMLDSVAPITTALPVQGIYASGPVTVSLSANEPQSVIYYTVDGTVPTLASSIYTTPIRVADNSTIKYFAVDSIGNAEPVKTGTWGIHTSDLVASLQINNATAIYTKSFDVNLLISAQDPVGVATMQFSNDGFNYSPEEPYATTRAWTLNPGDGLKTVYVRFRDKSLPTGNVYPPVTASITLDTLPPATTVTPEAGAFAGTPVLVNMSTSEPANIYYTIDGSIPNLSSNIYTTPISVGATTSIMYFAVDKAGNMEGVKLGKWEIHSADMISKIQINRGAARTNKTDVTLTLSATDPLGVATMKFSNDGVNYSAEEPYAVSKAWTLTPGDGAKTVYVRFRDKALPNGVLYPPVTATIVYDTSIPVTKADPVAGTYSVTPLLVTLTPSEAGTTYFTTDGTTPTDRSPVFVEPIPVTTESVIKYFTVDQAGNAEGVKSGTWTVHTSDMQTSFLINNGAPRTNRNAVLLTLSAVDPVGVDTMQFSDDGVNYTSEEPYATGKAWTLSQGDGLKTIYVRFRDKSLPSGHLYEPITASIVLDTVAPVSTASPVPGFYAGPVQVTLTANKEAKIFYTTDGLTPTAASTVYTTPLSLSADTTIKYFALDVAGNSEAVKSATWTFHSSDLVASVKINNGAVLTNDSNVTLTLAASDPVGIASMQFSNDGVNYSPEEPYATTKEWSLASVDGLNTVYVRFRDMSLGGGNLYDPVTAAITYGVKDGLLPGTNGYLASAYRALQLSNGSHAVTPLDLAHADVAPYVNGKPQPDGKIDSGDAYVLMLRAVGLLPL
jgi:FtsP/CotA-like multicopper oxidase with cupredoxin domain